MKNHTYNPPCKLVLVDSATDKPFLNDSPEMLELTKIWEEATSAERLGMYRVTCLNSGRPEDIKAGRPLAARMRPIVESPGRRFYLVVDQTGGRQTMRLIIDGQSREIDSRVVELVSYLNSMPGIKTRASCGGHESCDEDDWGHHVRAGSFYVDFGVEHSEAGWASLERITGSAAFCDAGTLGEPGDFACHVIAGCLLTDDNTPPEDLRFSLQGTCDPNDVVYYLKRFNLAAKGFLPGATPA